MANPKKALLQLQELQKYGKSLRLAAEWRESWKSLISTMLSARTRDEKTIDVSKNLFRKYSNLSKLASASIHDIEVIVRPVNYYKTKARSLVKCARILVEEHSGKVPVDFDELLKLPGVGRKTANVFLSEIGKDTIGVDTHLSYIARSLNWTKNLKPERIENDIKKLFPKTNWKYINPIAVRFGRTYQKRTEKDRLLKKIKQIKSR